MNLDKLLARIPRPERSGVLAVLLALSFALELFSIPGGDTNSLRCLITPWACVSPRSEVQQQRTTWITFSPGGMKKGKKPCTCHYDIRYTGMPIIHIHTEVEETCASANRDGMDEVYRLWSEAPELDPLVGGISYVNFYANGQHWELRHGQGQFRLHCDSDPQ